MHNDRSLCPNGGLSPSNVAKLDVAKLKTPKEWGWRCVVAGSRSIVTYGECMCLLLVDWVVAGSSRLTS